MLPLSPFAGVQIVVVEPGTMFADDAGNVVVVTETKGAVKDGVVYVVQATWDAIRKQVPTKASA